jgi:hypothetical protein
MLGLFFFVQFISGRKGMFSYVQLFRQLKTISVSFAIMLYATAKKREDGYGTIDTDDGAILGSKSTSA